MIGDLHGCLPALDVLLEAVAFDHQRDRLISCGDLIDRGPDSFGVVRRLKRWRCFHSVLGNHEGIAIEALATPCGSTPVWDEWVSLGGRWGTELSDRRRNEVGNTLSRIPLYLEVPLPDGRVVGIVHADLPIDTSPAGLEVSSLSLRQSVRKHHKHLLHQLLWGREDAKTANYVRAKGELSPELLTRLLAPLACPRNSGIDLAISGHTVMRDGPVWIEDRIFLDTGAGWPGGRLTIMEISTAEFWQVVSERPDISIVASGRIRSGN